MKAAIIFILLGFVPSLVFCWQASGRVKDVENHPLAGVKIVLVQANLSAVSDQAGGFTFSLPDTWDQGQLTTIEARAHQFYSGRLTIRITKNVVIPDIILIPMKMLKEDVTVTALNREEKAVAIPFAQNVTSQIAIRENLPESPVAAIANSPGVQFIGKGGISVTPSIRGLARRRILFMIDGSRLISDRSAGTAASFVPTDFVRRIEVVRSAASVLYGSDAIGGVINILTRGDPHPPGLTGNLNLNGNTVGNRLNGSIGFERQWSAFSLDAGLQYVTCDDYKTPEGTVGHSGYSYRTGRLSFSLQTEKRDFSVSFLKSAGRDIGKPERANDPDKYSFYPHEDNNLLQLAFREREIGGLGEFNFSIFMNPNSSDLSKVKESAKQVEMSFNNAVDWGWKTFFRKSVGKDFSYQWGLDYFGRFGVDMENRTTKNDQLISQSMPVADGRRGDFSLYATVDYSGLKMFDLVGGFRYGFFSRQASSDGTFMEKSSQAPAFFLGITRRIKDSLSVFFNVGTAFRMPSLSEAFYTGITGRTNIVGNPDLKPEWSLNLDAGIRFYRQNTFIGLYLFQCTVSDMIEKFPLSDTAYTYDNIEKGRIRGLEVEFQVSPFEHWEFFGNGFYYFGESVVSGQPLNDVPSPKIVIGSRFWRGSFWAEVNWLWSGKMNRPGPAESAVDSYQTVDLKSGLYLSSHVNLFVKIWNLFNELYYPNADPDIPPAKGRDVSAGVSILF